MQASHLISRVIYTCPLKSPTFRQNVLCKSSHLQGRDASINFRVVEAAEFYCELNLQPEFNNNKKMHCRALLMDWLQDTGAIISYFIASSSEHFLRVAVCYYAQMQNLASKAQVNPCTIGGYSYCPLSSFLFRIAFQHASYIWCTYQLIVLARPSSCCR